MTRQALQVSRTLRVITLIFMLGISLGIPTVYWFASVRYEQGSLRTVAKLKAAEVSERVASNPDLWMFETDRLLALLKRTPTGDGLPERRLIHDRQGRVLAEHHQPDADRWPVLREVHPVMDATHHVAEVVIERSISDIWIATLWAGASSIAAALMAFFLLQTLPLSALRRAEERMSFLAHHDPLTGLPNRAQFMEHTQQTLQKLGHQGKAALLFIDLDRFKLVNDSLGHSAGDHVLRLSAERLRASVRKEDFLARLGGDEFTLVLEQVDDPAAIAELGQRIVAALAEPMQVHDQTVHIGASIGMALYPQDATDADGLVRCADAAMYHAKRFGRNVCHFYTESMNARWAARLQLEHELRLALDQQEFVLFWQPIVDARDGHIVRAEGLLRWQHPQRGLVPPGEFIGLLEDTGMVVAAGAWVITEACRQLRLWSDRGLPSLAVSVNVSPRQFRDIGLIGVLQSACATYDIAPHRLELEVTEGLLIDEHDVALDTIRAIRKLGVRVAVDDFGTGYSSLAYLKRFRLNVLKIDRSFVRDMHVDPDDEHIVTAIIALARSLRLEVTVEGVETAAQRQRLVELGAHLHQGYFYGRPLPAAEFEQRLLREARDVLSEHLQAGHPAPALVLDEALTA